MLCQDDRGFSFAWSSIWSSHILQCHIVLFVLGFKRPIYLLTKTWEMQLCWVVPLLMLCNMSQNYCCISVKALQMVMNILVSRPTLCFVKLFCSKTFACSRKRFQTKEFHTTFQNVVWGIIWFRKTLESLLKSFTLIRFKCIRVFLTFVHSFL